MNKITEQAKISSIYDNINHALVLKLFERGDAYGAAGAERALIAALDYAIGLLAQYSKQNRSERSLNIMNLKYSQIQSF